MAITPGCFVLCPNDTLGITVRTKSNFVKKQPPEGSFINLGIGIGIRIGTDTANAIISSSIKPMDTKPSRVTK